MAIVSIPFTFSAGAVIIASQHNSNFSVLYSDYDGNIDNTNIAPAAAIAYSKLSLTGSIVNADVASGAAIVASKLDLTSPGAIGSTAPNTGAFTTLKVGTTHQGDILYDNGTTLTRLTPGTSGQVLTTAGASANPSWGTPGALKLISVTSFSSASTSGSITLDSTKLYLVKVVLTASSVSPAIWIRYNTVSTSSYGYVYRGFNLAASSSNGNAAIDGAAQILTGTTFSVLTGEYLYLDFSIFPQATASDKAILAKGTIYGQDASSNFTYNDFLGLFRGATVTSFAILPSTGTIDGTVYLYSYALS